MIFFYECEVNIRILKEVISFIFFFFSLFCDVSLETFFCGITGSLIQCLEKSFRKGCNLSLFMLCCKGGGKKPDWWESIHTNQPEAGLVFGLCPCQSAVLRFITCCITLSLTCASRALATSKCTLFCAHQQGSCQCGIRKWKKSIENKDNSLRHILFGSLCFTWHNAFFEGAGGYNNVAGS